jgi:hypothetical protein
MKRALFVNAGGSAFRSVPGGTMKNTNGSEDWRVLCQLASKEQDPEKLIDLVVQINQALEESHQKSRYPVNANGYSYSVAPQLAQSAEYDC